MRACFLAMFAVLSVLVVKPSGHALAAELPDRPLTLDECVKLSLQYSPSLSVARQDVLAAQANLRGALSTYYPTAAYTATKGRTGGTSFVETPAGTIPFTISGSRNEAEVSLSYMLWETGRKDSLRRTERSLEAAAGREQTTVQELVLSISQLYYAALATEQLVGVAEATLAAAVDHEKLVKARASVGEAAAVDVVPAEADRAAAEFSLLQAENEADLAKARLKRTMGIPPTYQLRLAEPPPVQAEDAFPPLEKAVALAFEHRPDLAGTRSSVEGGRDALRLARKLERGVIRVVAGYDHGIAGPKEGQSWSALASATAFLFDGGARRADIDGARARLASVQAQEQQLVNDIGLEVESALLDVQTNRKSIDASEKAVASAEAQLAAAEGKYREGVGIFVEILDAQKAVARARTNRVQAIYNYQTALVALERAMGLLSPTTPAQDSS